MRHAFLVIALVGAVVGFIFASYSTYDFAQHLDRQVHGLHCSFVPGLDEVESGGSGCEVTLMSRYSSVFRDSVWGGLPITLPGMSVFAFLICFGLDLAISGRATDRRATGFFALATLVPSLTSLVMGYIAINELDAVCKLCIGMYSGSALALVGALGLVATAFTTPTLDDDDRREVSEDEDDMAWKRPTRAAGATASYAFLAAAFGVGLLFVVIPAAAYVSSAPDHSRFVGKCGLLEKEPDAELLVAVGLQNGVAALEIFDPLCPACEGFESQLAKTEFNAALARKAIPFPLDKECNWMLGESVHPGACAVSEAILCAGSNSDKVIEWAFAGQEKIREVAAADPVAGRKLVTSQFPELASCVGSPEVKQKLNRSLRWAVDNKLPLLTPQLYVGGVRLCDEDVDLGLEFALRNILDRHKAGTLPKPATNTATTAPVGGTTP
jgi:uncharacterized membrane protein